jgi:o-succinylbenzoate synthase
MKIEKITAAAWDVPMRAPYRSAQRVTTTARNVLVTVTLEGGTVGYGESAPATYVTGETQDSVLAALGGIIAGTRTPAKSGDLLAEARVSLRETPGAYSALVMAVFDATARGQGKPLYEWLGAGVGLKEFPAPSHQYVTERATDLSLPILPPDEAATRAAQAARDGFRALKIKVGVGDLGEDEARARAVAGAAPGATLRLDGNQGFAPEEAVAFIERLSDLLPRIEMLEQPTKAHDDAAMAFVAQRIPVPVFADESVHTSEDARRLVESGVCGGVVLKLAKADLVTAARIAREAHRAGGKCLFGCMMETRVAITAALHLTAALGPDVVPMLDLDGHLLVDDAALVDGGLRQTGDVLSLDPSAPGLGLTVRR